MEQTHASEGHDHALLVALGNDQVISDGAAGLGNVLDAGSSGPLDVVGEGEESVGTQGHAVKAGQESLLVFLGQPFRLTGEVVLPLPLM